MLAGLVIVASLLYLNLTVSVGTINGLILYANIIAANSSTFLPFLNFDLGLETHFFNGMMDKYRKVGLQFTFPAYVIFLVCLCCHKNFRFMCFSHTHTETYRDCACFSCSLFCLLVFLQCSLTFPGAISLSHNQTVSCL